MWLKCEIFNENYFRNSRNLTMKEKWNYLLYLLWFSFLIVSAIHMFGQGFLLSRKTLNDISECLPLNAFDCEGRKVNTNKTHVSCSEEVKIRKILLKSSAPMICLQNRNKVVFLLVDALRYDFTEYNDTNTDAMPYQNKLPIINSVLKSSPKSSRLFRFMADPPTTTLQRLKALMTGSLPTFIDASSNFAAMELQEDNIIDQVKYSSFILVIYLSKLPLTIIQNVYITKKVVYKISKLLL